MRLIRHLDYPPIWLGAFLFLVWLTDRVFPGLSVTVTGQGWLALVAAIGGAGLMVSAAVRMARARTTIVPHRDPAALVTDGVFAVSRNPIYLGDLLVLLAAMAWSGAVIALPLAWLFKRVIETRFIDPEEARLRDLFGGPFAEWSRSTRRWI